MSTLFKESLSVVNVGLAGFAADIVAAGGDCIALDWQPPAQGDRDAAWALATITKHPRIERANEEAFRRFAAAQPVLVDMVPARDALPGMAGGRRLILHAGPPIAWASMCGPMQGAILGAAVLEGWADSVDAATRLVEIGRDRPRALPSPRRGRTDGGDRQPVDAAVGRREPHARQPRVQQLQRRARQGAALRRQRTRGDRAPATSSRASSPPRSARRSREPAASS